MPAAKGAKGRKIGRNKTSCESYRREGRQEKNAALRQARHLRRLKRMTARTARKAA